LSYQVEDDEDFIVFRSSDSKEQWFWVK
jgi:hypothetical protein